MFGYHTILLEVVLHTDIFLPKKDSRHLSLPQGQAPKKYIHTDTYAQG